ncbi:PAS domain-containing sensor histidine kinase [Aquabacterium sp. NJ1]|uniref:PAS domain-containing sensor histidine kinase n=1 Tax=Aquabacterium sp. NJ1 TaxID=1538295 RepID=UPI0009DD1B79|nr:PAS domain-containing sensor histidine kinase [Aquabacterium sp. NJ1]
MPNAEPFRSMTEAAPPSPPSDVRHSHQVPDFMHMLVDHVPAMLAYWGADLRCRFANKAYKTWFGVDPAGLIGTHIKDLLGPELFALNEPYIRGALRGEEQLFERVVPGKDGVQRHSLATYIPDMVDGKAVGFMSHVTEVTKLKEAEAALRAQVAEREHAYECLRQSETALREAQQLGQIGSWELDLDTNAPRWSDEMYRIFGLDPSQPLPPYTERAHLYPPESWARLTRQIEHTTRTGEPYLIELAYFKPGGGIGWVEARGMAVRNPQGHIFKLAGTLMEVTERHHVEEARVQRDVALAANRNKTMLLSRVSHELRTPLNGIMGYAQLNLMQPGLDATQRQRNEIILQCGQHMVELVDDMLDLSGAELGRITVQRAALDLAPLVEASLLHFGPLADAMRVELVNRLVPHEAFHAMADPMRAQQVINHLVSNAIKYNRPEGRVTVSAHRSDTHIDIRVEDTGVGLTAQQLARLFTPFDRLGAEATSVEGTGVGLALSKVLVDLMGGELLVESQPGKGSAFTLRLARSAATNH